MRLIVILRYVCLKDKLSFKLVSIIQFVDRERDVLLTLPLIYPTRVRLQDQEPNICLTVFLNR